jgi:hypothetical protein
MNVTKVKSFLKHNKIYIFPAVLFLLLVVLTSLRLSGTSIGIYHEYLYGETSKDPNLLFGKPQSIRSDEWLVNTQLTIAQEENGLKPLNDNFNNYKDMSLLGDSPYMGWSAIFKPQNLSFFIMPLEYAFAFKWWLLLFSLMASVYFFSLKLLPRKIGIAVASAIIIACSPFVAWWYLTGTIATLCYGFLIALACMGIIDHTQLTFFKKKLSQRASLLVKGATLSYLLASFGLLLYPPFQIPVALVVAFFILGYLINAERGKSRKFIALSLVPFAVSVALAGALLGAFLYEHSTVFTTVSKTAYPGQRVISSGGQDITKLLTTYLQSQLQREDRGKHYYKNQSESSSFIVLPLYFILPAIGLLVWLYIKKRRIEWALLGLIAVCLIFFAVLFIPNIDIISKVFLLTLVPHYRLVIGLGFLAIILILYMVKVFNEHKLSFNRKAYIIILLYSLVFFSLMLLAGLETSKLYPVFISSKKLILLLAGIVMLGSTLILLNRPKIGLLILAVFSLASSMYVNPLYRGLGPLRNSEISKSIQTVAPPNAIWAAAQDILIENLPQMSGRPAVTGVSTYPENAFWEKYSGKSNSFIYNRYAHIVLSSNDKNSLVLATPDLITVSASCSRRITEKIEYIVSTTPLEGSCNSLLKTVTYPAITFYLYKQ